jgi:protoheme IX farnesyltransferase
VRVFIPGEMRMLKEFLELSKIRILVMQLVTFAMGYVLATRFFWQQSPFYWGLVGTAFASAGAAFLNHALEVDVDKKMKRTENRPLPMGRVSRLSVSIVGLILSVVGVGVMGFFVNSLTAFLTFMTVFLYVAVYTPMKRFSWMNTLVGAVPGALPPLGGWAAATMSVSVEGWFLFVLLFVWQLPHFYAIAWLCKEDYKAAGFKMISVMDEAGVRSGRQMIVMTVVLILISLFPVVFQMKGWVYGVGALLCGGYFLRSTVMFLIHRSDESAKSVLKGSVLYLVCLLVLLLV